MQERMKAMKEKQPVQPAILSEKKGIEWKALGCYGIGAAVSVAVPAVMMMFVFG